MKTHIYSLSILPNLIVGKDSLSIDEVPKPFRNDLKTFLIGETFMPSKDGKLRIGANLYASWIKKLVIKGFDEDVNLEVDES